MLACAPVISPMSARDRVTPGFIIPLRVAFYIFQRKRSAEGRYKSLGIFRAVSPSQDLASALFRRLTYTWAAAAWRGMANLFGQHGVSDDVLRSIGHFGEIRLRRL